MNSRNRPIGSAVMPDASVSIVTANAPSSSPTTEASSDAAMIRPGDAPRLISGRNNSG